MKHYGKWHSIGDLEARVEDGYVVVRGKRSVRLGRAPSEKVFFSEAALDVMRELFRNARRIEREKKNKTLRSKTRRMRRAPPTPFSVLVHYKGGPDALFEIEIERAARGRPGGSGYCFISDTRDVEYRFTRRASALAAAKRVRKLRRGLKVEVTGRIWP